MATTAVRVPPYELPGVPPLPQPASAGEPSDPSLATEVLPAPPTLASVQQAATKRDPRKITPLVSYLPQNDPGTTFSSHLAVPVSSSILQGPSEGRRPKRARVDKE
jgi:hypothetical protein